MTEVFADSFYYIALLNPADAYHAEAVRLTRSLQFPVVTTSWLLVEVADALSAPRIRPFTHRFLSQLAQDANVRIVMADPAGYQRGLQLYGDRPDKNWSLTDCISFTVMTERGITDVLTADQHFFQAGFRTLFAPRSG